MEWPPPSTSPSPSLVVRSPRQTVSLIRNRRPQRDWNPSSRSPSFATRDHGPKPSEVYGFVGSITTVIATAVYLAWAYTPEPVLRSLGITYYPSKYWALAVPSFVIVAVALSMAIYMGLNFVATLPQLRSVPSSMKIVGSAQHFLQQWKRRGPSNPFLTLVSIKSTILCLLIDDYSR
ncbi:hypothetical protein BS78_K284600 [Paspalum vaginatum]|uniref:PIG-P domain-containing protein n=1 Tax=Paspalum vaginatum TaxID=158149 RepID=A0A9W8CEG0_9POAL|nr:hypothetical protein BS78_K284600 [Paspalum vaginatum]